MTAEITKEQLDASRRAWELAVPGPQTCICGDASGEVIDDHDRFGLPLSTIRCSSCGTLRSSHVVADEHLSRFYRELYPVMHPGLNADREARERRQEKWLIGNTDIMHVSVKKVLEIGGVTGRLLGVERYDSYDLSSDDRCTVRDADLLIALHVLEHCTDPVATLRSWSSALAPGGTMLVAVPRLLEVDTHRYVEVMGLGGWWQIAHAWNWSDSNVELPFIKAGLEVLDKWQAEPWTIATVGSLVVEAMVETDIDKYIKTRLCRG